MFVKLVLNKSSLYSIFQLAIPQGHLKNIKQHILHVMGLTYVILDIYITHNGMLKNGYVLV